MWILWLSVLCHCSNCPSNCLRLNVAPSTVSWKFTINTARSLHATCYDAHKICTYIIRNDSLLFLHTFYGKAQACSDSKAANDLLHKILYTQLEIEKTTEVLKEQIHGHINGRLFWRQNYPENMSDNVKQSLFISLDVQIKMKLLQRLTQSRCFLQCHWWQHTS